MIPKDVELPGNRRFGLFFCAVFALLATICWFGAAFPAAAALALASFMIALVALVRPLLLEPFNRAWIALGLTLGAIFNPIVLGILFFGIITPVALATRLFGRDELRLRRPATANGSHWINRDPPGPDPDTLRRQY